MKEIRKNQVIGLLECLNGMYCGDFGHDCVSYAFSDGYLLVSASTRDIRFGLELLLCKFMHMSVYVVSNTDLQIMFYD